MKGLLPLVALLAVAAGACGGDNSSSPVSTTATTVLSDTLLGVVQAPVNGILQSDFKTFTMSAGTISIVLTSAIETLPGGSLLTTIVMGIDVGTSSNGVCTLLSGSHTAAQSGAATVLQGTLVAGTYCVQVSDVTSQLGPVQYAVQVTHP